MAMGSENCRFTTKNKIYSTHSFSEADRNRNKKRIKTASRIHKPLHSGGQLILLGICTAAFMLLFAFKIIGSSDAQDVLASMRELQNAGSDQDDRSNAEETLGRLKLVQLPSIIEVFSPSDSPILPLAFDRAIEEESTMIAKLYAPTGTQVVSMLAGTVKAVSVDDKLGGYVIVSCEGDIELYYYGLNDIAVERGQPILQHSTLGTIANDILCIRVLQHGRPIDPLDFLGVAAEAG